MLQHCRHINISVNNIQMCLYCDITIAAKDWPGRGKPSFIFHSCSNYCAAITKWMPCNTCRTEKKMMYLKLRILFVFTQTPQSPSYFKTVVVSQVNTLGINTLSTDLLMYAMSSLKESLLCF